ncbi:unnamed protein product [Darwinula stevensoni]|uniref:Peptidase S1 domain-containing protein n=1 Tax=Darwinula stevensoni TaxID=69355 RepID=A0A7R8ZZT4_9CRUS|nr:unnamed protein product [Darwinula stevensoni]CAG0883160.1 unnamed protein product [Darwinula stevensoni]
MFTSMLILSETQACGQVSGSPSTPSIPSTPSTARPPSTPSTPSTARPPSAPSPPSSPKLWLYRLWNRFITMAGESFDMQEREELDPLIVNGAPATITEAPFMAFAFMQFNVLGYRSNSSCSASILNERWILTAAHCINSFPLQLRGELGVPEVSPPLARNADGPEEAPGRNYTQTLEDAQNSIRVLRIENEDLRKEVVDLKGEMLRLQANRSRHRHSSHHRPPSRERLPEIQPRHPHQNLSQRPSSRPVPRIPQTPELPSIDGKPLKTKTPPSSPQDRGSTRSASRLDLDLPNPLDGEELGKPKEKRKKHGEQLAS